MHSIFLDIICLDYVYKSHKIIADADYSDDLVLLDQTISLLHFLEHATKDIRGSLNIFLDLFFVWPLLLIVHTGNSSPFRSNLLRQQCIVVPFQQLLKGPMEVNLCERVNDFRHSLFHLFNCLITTASEHIVLLKCLYVQIAFLKFTRCDNRVYSNCCCSCSFERKIIKIGQSSYKTYSNNILNYQGSTTILKAIRKKVWKPIEGTTYI